MSESNSISPRQRMRALLAAEACVAPASVHDPISARIAEHLEFELGIFAGSVASLTVLGAPDLILLTLTEFAEQARRITRASTLPILVDADHGYGNALNVMRCVQELEAAGISAMSIEDTELPQPAGAGGKPRLVSIEEGVGKMRAALAARGARRDHRAQLRHRPGAYRARRAGGPARSGVGHCRAHQRPGHYRWR